MPGLVLPILFIVTDRFVDFYVLKQFAPVIHGNRQARGRIAMGKNPRRKGVAFFSIVFGMGQWQGMERFPKKFRYGFDAASFAIACCNFGLLNLYNINQNNIFKSAAPSSTNRGNST
ncbi:MAG: hypothetical protein WA081_01875 [Desulfosalsimonadaceae bacterium]